MKSEKYKYKYIGKIVVRDGENKKGEKYKYSMLQLGERYFATGQKKGEVIPPVTLSKDEKARLLDIILEKDLYLFDPHEEAPEFIKKYIAVKTEDVEEQPKKKSRNDDDL